MKKSYFVLPLISALAFVSVFELSSSPSMAGGTVMTGQEKVADMLAAKLVQFPTTKRSIDKLIMLKENAGSDIFRFNYVNPNTTEVIFSPHSWHWTGKPLVLRGGADEVMFEIFDLEPRVNLMWSRIDCSDIKVYEYIKSKYPAATFSYSEGSAWMALEKRDLEELRNSGFDIKVYSVSFPMAIETGVIGSLPLNKVVELVRKSEKEHR